MSNLRWLKKADGTVVLQKNKCSFHDECEKCDCLTFWENIPTIEEPAPKKELWEVLKKAYWSGVPGGLSEDLWKKVSTAAREYLEEERSGG